MGKARVWIALLYELEHSGYRCFASRIFQIHLNWPTAIDDADSSLHVPYMSNLSLCVIDLGAARC